MKRSAAALDPCRSMAETTALKTAFRVIPPLEGYMFAFLFLILFFVLLAAWIICWAALHLAGGFIHILLILAVIFLIVHFVHRRSVV